MGVGFSTPQTEVSLSAHLTAALWGADLSTVIKAPHSGERLVQGPELSWCPHHEPQLWKGIWITYKKKTKQCFPSVVFFLFASPAPSEPLLGVLSCLNLLVCVSGDGAGPCPGGAAGAGQGPGVDGPRSMPRPPRVALYVVHVTPIKHAS